MTPTFFETPEQFRAWLHKHHATASELIVGYWKVDSGRRSMTWPESVDEALCVGWIDGVRRRIDDSAYSIRFTPRRAKSIWSLVNIARVKVLTAEGRMLPAGLAAFEARTDKKSGVYAFEQDSPAELTAAELRVFKRNKRAWVYFEASAPSYRRVILHWIVSAKQAATRERRLEKLIEASAEERRILR